MDIMVVPLPSNANKVFRNYKANDGNKNLNYIFIININTKYLFEFPSFKKDTSSIINYLDCMIYVYDIKIDNIRSDDDSAFRNDLRNWLERRGITYYYSPFKYTIRNRVVDRVVGTSVELYYPEIMKMTVNNIIIKYTNLYLISLLLTKHNISLLSNRPF
jgi:hypothetical protein